MTSVSGPYPTVCDYGSVEDPIDPPLAVNMNKKSMTKKTLAEYPECVYSSWSNNCPNHVSCHSHVVGGACRQRCQLCDVSRPIMLDCICPTVAALLNQTDIIS